MKEREGEMREREKTEKRCHELIANRLKEEGRENNGRKISSHFSKFCHEQMEEREKERHRECQRDRHIDRQAQIATYITSIL